MAITLDNVSATLDYNADPPVSPITLSVTVNSGSDRCLVFTLARRGISATVSGVTANGVAMTKLRDDSAATVRSSIYYLVAPDVGTYNISIAHDAVAGQARWVGKAISLFGVDQTNPVDAQNGANGSSTGPMTTTVTTNTADTWIVDVCAMRLASSDTATMTAMTNRTQRLNTIQGGVGAGLRGLGSTVGPAASAGAYAMEWTKTLNQQWAISAIALKEVSVAVSTGRTFITTPARVASGTRTASQTRGSVTNRNFV